MDKYSRESSVMFIIVISIISSVVGQFEGDNCIYNPTRERGICLKLKDCASAVAILRHGESPQTCSFSGTTPIVCCVGGRSVVSSTASTITVSPPSSTDNQNCPPLPSIALKVNKNGQKAWDKCIDLAETIFKCKKSEVIGGPRKRVELCAHPAATFVVGGISAGDNEFPHMALLGYGDLSTATWECGGTLISRQWVMTAAHCTFSRMAGTDVKYVRLGSPNINAPLDKSKTYNVTKIIEHPQRSPPQFYNDIALLKLDRDVLFSQSVIPACLHVGLENQDYAIVTGWGVDATQGKQSNNLQKVTLEKFTHRECSTAHPPEPAKAPKGIDNNTQICYGSRNEVKDSCKGDSGGPLQVPNDNVYCTYTVIGIVSVGKGCAIKGVPGLYTRVAAYIPWIERIVWPAIKMP